MSNKFAFHPRRGIRFQKTIIFDEIYMMQKGYRMHICGYIDG